MNSNPVTRINNNTYGNPRHVCHFLRLLTESEKDRYRGELGDRDYNLALRKAKAHGGRKFHNKQYGGGVRFYGTEQDVLDVIEILSQQEGVPDKVKVKL